MGSRHVETLRYLWEIWCGKKKGKTKKERRNEKGNIRGMEMWKK